MINWGMPTCLWPCSCSRSMLVTYLVSNSKYGCTLRSIRENEQLARSVGINTNMHKVGAFMLSGLFAGVGGASASVQFPAYFA